MSSASAVWCPVSGAASYVHVSWTHCALSSWNPLRLAIPLRRSCLSRFPTPAPGIDPASTAAVEAGGVLDYLLTQVRGTAAATCACVLGLTDVITRRRPVVCRRCPPRRPELCVKEHKINIAQRQCMRRPELCVCVHACVRAMLLVLSARRHGHDVLHRPPATAAHQWCRL